MKFRIRECSLFDDYPLALEVWRPELGGWCNVDYIANEEEARARAEAYVLDPRPRVLGEFELAAPAESAEILERQKPSIEIVDGLRDV